MLRLAIVFLVIALIAASSDSPEWQPFPGTAEDTLRCLPDPRRSFLRRVWFQEANVLGVVKL